MAVTWDAGVWQTTYPHKIGLATYGASYAPCTFSGQVCTAVGHGLAPGDKVVFLGTTNMIPLENVAYPVLTVPDADTFTVSSGPIPDQACQWSRSRLGEVGTYGRAWKDLGMPGVYEQRWSNLVRDMGILPTETVLVGGCAKGYLIEVAHDAGYPEVYGAENSAYILTDIRADVKIAAIDFTQMGAGPVRQVLKAATGYTDFDWIITEDMAPGFTDAEVVTGSNVAAGRLNHGIPQTHVVNMVTEAPITHVIWNAHTLEEWKALVPSQSWVSIRLSQWRVL